MLTFSPALFSKVAIEAAAMPLPSELSTPPVTKMYFVCMDFLFEFLCEIIAKQTKIDLKSREF